MVLRIPRSLDDSSLLEDEPFLTEFCICELVNQGRDRGRPLRNIRIEKELRAVDGGLRAAEVWLRAAFGPETPIDSAGLDAFIQFYWLIKQKEHREAERHIHMISKKRNLSFRPDMSAVIGESSAALAQPQPPKKKRNRRSMSKRRRSRGHGYQADVGMDVDEPAQETIPRREIMDDLQPPSAPAPVASVKQSGKRGQKRKANKQTTIDESSPEDIPVTIDAPFGLGATSASTDAARSVPTLPNDDLADSSEAAKALPAVLKPSTRTNPLRLASKRENLTMIMKKEHLWQTKGRKSTDAWNFDEEAAPAEDKRVVSVKKRKQKARPPSISEVPEPSPPVAVPSQTCVIDARPLRDAHVGTLSPAPAPKPQQARKTRKFNKKVAAPPIHVLKKRKCNEESDSIVTAEAGPDPVLPSLGPSSMHAPSAQRDSRKRLRDSEASGPMIPAKGQQKGFMGRVIAPLRKPRSKEAKSDLQRPAIAQQIQAPPSLGQGFISINAVLQNAAAAAQELQNCTDEAASDWEIDKPDDPELDGYPGSDIEDDTTEMPAREALPRAEQPPEVVPVQNNRTQDTTPPTYLLTYPLISEDVPDPSTTKLPVHDTPYNSIPYPDSDVEDDPDAHMALELAYTLPRMPLPAYPPIWAESRQEVCEGFDAFRSYQGGVYFASGIVKGYLLGGFSASRDIFYNNGKLIISHGGGKAESLHKTNGHWKSHEASDQMEGDKSVRALLENHRQRRPLALLIDDKYALFPYDLASKGCTYAVLGWYVVAHAWAEYQPAVNSQGRAIRYKFAFQWCEGQGEPWWTQSPFVFSTAPVTPLVLQVQYEKCSSCECTSPQIYVEAWMCLKPHCRMFWRPTDDNDSFDNLTYSPSFLNPLEGLTKAPNDLRPKLVLPEENGEVITTSRHFCKGWHCHKCGRLSCRYKWEHWECRNCGTVFSVTGRLRVAAEFRLQAHGKTFYRHTQHASIFCSRTMAFESGKSWGQRITFVLPHDRGRIHLLIAAPLDNAHADDILKVYQEEALAGHLKFRRWPLRAHKCRGTLLTNYFSQNTGEPYQYVGGTANTVPFSEAPSAVLGALDLIKLRIQQAKVDVGTEVFNEVLTAAYMEQQKMAFHSDSERGLGPVVASLSLGASAYMYFRLHAHYAAAELGAHQGREVLQLFLRHGDVLVMEGAGVQTFYEHTVVPQNFRIAATARFIGNDHH